MANFKYKYCKSDFLPIERCQSVPMLKFQKVLHTNEFQTNWHVFFNIWECQNRPYDYMVVN